MLKDHQCLYIWAFFSHEIRQINFLYEILPPWVNEKAQRMYTHVDVALYLFFSIINSVRGKIRKRERRLIFTCELFDIVFHKLVNTKK